MNSDSFDGYASSTSRVSLIGRKTLTTKQENGCLLLGLLSCQQCGSDLQSASTITSESLVKYYCQSCHAHFVCDGASAGANTMLQSLCQAVLDEHVWYSLLNAIANSEKLGQCWRELGQTKVVTSSSGSLKQLDELDLDALSAQVSFEDKRQILSLTIDRIIVEPDAKNIFFEGPLQGLYGDAMRLDLAGEVNEAKEYISSESKELLARVYGYLLRQARQRKINSSLETF